MRKPCVGYENTKEMRWDKSKGQEKRWGEKRMREVKIMNNRAWEGCDISDDKRRG